MFVCSKHNKRNSTFKFTDRYTLRIYSFLIPLKKIKIVADKFNCIIYVWLLRFPKLISKYFEIHQLLVNVLQLFEEPKVEKESISRRQTFSQLLSDFLDLKHKEGVRSLVLETSRFADGYTYSQLQNLRDFYSFHQVFCTILWI